MEEVVNEIPVTEVPAGLEPAPVVTPVLSGDKTPPNKLLESLQEEREKRRELEERISVLESSNNLEAFSDEGKALERQIKEQDSKIETLLQDNAKKDVLLRYPDLKDKWQEVEEYRQAPENKGMNLNTAVKAYMVENGLLEPQRKGLEKTTGGERTAPSQKMTAEDVKNLRETDFKKYQDLLEKGLI